MHFGPLIICQIELKYCDVVFSDRTPNKMNCLTATLEKLLCLYDHYILYIQHLMVAIWEKCVSMHDD